MQTPRFRILVDNHPHFPGAIAEHGLSIWIEAGGKRFLFDTGKSDAVVKNAEASGIDLSTADHLILSHGHYDHCGGLEHLDEILPPSIPIHFHEDLSPQRYSRHADGSIHEIGLPENSRAMLQKRRAFHADATCPVEISPGVFLTGQIPRISDFEDTGGDFWLDENCTLPDPIADDIAVWVVGPEGLWIFPGCAHSGVVNTVRHIINISGCDRIHALIGGMHLPNSSHERLEKTARFLRELDAKILLPCHCSGNKIQGLI